jgi:hypothetical protein
MPDKQNSHDKPLDPMEPWRGVRDAYLEACSKTMIDMVNSEAYAQASGAILDTSLTASTPFREAVEKAMLKTLEQLAMPTRADVISIAERMTNIEMRLDDLDAKLDLMLGLIAKASPASVAGPARAAASKAFGDEKTAGRSKTNSKPVKVKRGK